MALSFAFLLLLAILGGCNNNFAPKEKIRLNEATHSIFYAPQYVAIENGYFKNEGIDLDIVTDSGSGTTMVALISGNADIGLMGTETSIHFYNEGIEDYIVNFAGLTQRAGNFLVARENIDSFTWEHIKGRHVLGGKAGQMPQIIFEYILKKNGIDPKRHLTIEQSIDFGSTSAAFSEGQGDFTIEFEPSATILEIEKKAYIVASLGVDSGYLPYTSYCVKKSYMEKNPDTIQRFTNALQQGMDYVNTHNAKEIAKVIAPHFSEIDIEAIEIIIERYQEQNTWKDNLILEENSFDLLQNILEEYGTLSERVLYDNLVNTTYAKESISKPK